MRITSTPFASALAALTVLSSFALEAEAQAPPGVYVATSTGADSAIMAISGGGDFTNATPFATGLTTNAGGGTHDVCYGPNGDLYATDPGNNRIMIVSAGGDVSGTTPFATGINGPIGLFCTANEIFVTSFNFTTFSGGQVIDITGGGDFTAAPAQATGFQNIPVAVFRSQDGTLYATDVDVFVTGVGAIYDISAAGTNILISTPVASGGTNAPLSGLSEEGLLPLAGVLSQDRLATWTTGTDFGSGNNFGNAATYAQVQQPLSLTRNAGALFVSNSSGMVFDVTGGGNFLNEPPYATGLNIGFSSFGGLAVVPGCGNDVVDAGEDCDDGVESADCNANCTAASCGDGVFNATAGEACDDGGPSADCNADCTIATCGDLVVNPAAGEDCDEGGVESATCDANCTAVVCGDSTVNAAAGEECDDGRPSANCDADCTVASCGDGTTNPAAGEQCDEGGETATCDADCTSALCGDGSTNVAAGEECDDGGESVSCDADCTAVVCGDGVINSAAGEACDDGNQVPGDGCDAQCAIESTTNATTTTGAGGAGGGGGSVPAPTTDASGGCDCATSGEGSPAENTAALLLLGALVAIGRRRREQR